MTPTIASIKAAFAKLGYRWSPDFNIVGIRKANGTVNQFDDLIGWVSDSELRLFEATTEPGLTALQAPINKAGTSIMVPGQYRDAYQIGYHQQKADHPAFVQVGPVRVYRDNNKDSTLDINPLAIGQGIFGINIHRSNATGATPLVGPWSAGCQVLRRKTSLDELLAEAKATGLSKFTYTLLMENSLS